MAATNSALFVERFRKYVSDNELFTTDDRILLTVSGGVDSMVMLSLFTECGYNVGVAHCNFCLRGAESDEDEVLVAEEAQKKGVVCYNRRFDTQGEMERTGESMEMAARRLRYAWFDELCAEHGYNVIAVAHHIDDSIETFFINLLRGTGLRGLTGITTHRGNIVRPLMFASRKEITEYAVSQHIPYREDSSNRSTKYLRNKIRLGLVPMIREINPKFTSLMRGNIAHLTEAQVFINYAIEIVKRSAIEERDGIYYLRLENLGEGIPHDFVAYEILSSTYGFKSDVVRSLMAAYRKGSTGKRFYSKEWVAYLERGEIAIAPIADDDDCEVMVDADAMRSFCGNSVLYYEHTDVDQIKAFGVPENMAQIDADKLCYPLRLRRWRNGDWFVPFGMTGRKKVGDLLTDLKVPTHERKRQFVLLSGEDIVWVVGRRIDDRYALTSESENVLKITREIV